MEVAGLYTILVTLSVTIGFSLALLWAWDEANDDWIYRQSTRPRLKKSCRKYLAGYKQPANILVIKEKDIPRSTTGKVQRHLVEKMLKPVFNLEMVN